MRSSSSKLPKGYETSIYDNFSPSSYAAFCNAYSALQNSGYECLTTFPLYFRAATEHLENSVRPLIIVMKKNGEITGMIIGRVLKLPIVMRIGGFSISNPVRNCLIVPENGFIVKDNSPEHCEALLKALYGSFSLKAFTVINLLWIPLDSAIYKLSISKRYWMLRDYFPIVEKHWFTDLEKPFETMLMQRSRKHRGNLRRTMKKIEETEKNKFRLKEFRHTYEVDDLVNDTEHVASMSYQRAWGVGFIKNKSIEEVLRVSANDGNLLSYVLYAHNKPCAFQIGIVHKGTYYIPYLAHDRNFSYYDPGTYLLLKSLMAVCSLDQVKVVDYGWSDNFLKQRFGSRHRLEANLSFFAPAVDGLLICLGISMTGSITRVFKILTGFSKIEKKWKKYKLERGVKKRRQFIPDYHES